MNIKKKEIYLRLPLLTFKSMLMPIIIGSFPVIREELSFRDVQLGFIVSFYYFFLFIGSIIWSYLLEKKSPKIIFYVGAYFWIVPIFFFRLTNSLWGILICISINGFSSESTTIIILND